MEIREKKILVLGGAGKSGQAAATLFLRLGGRVSLSDSNSESKLSLELTSAMSECPGRLIDVRPREGVDLLDDAPDFIVIAPGVAMTIPLVSEGMKRGIQVYGENDLASELLQAHWKKPPRVCAITGTDGKSTTTALLSEISRAAGISSVPCGNFGTPLSSLVLSSPENQKDLLSLECSSFQLEPARFMHPHVAMILNLNQDHLDRYADLETYLAAKLNILKNQTAEDLFIAPQWILEKAISQIKSSGVRSLSIESINLVRPEGIFFRNFRVMDLAQFVLPGAHNRSNLNCALAALDDLARRSGNQTDISLLGRAIANFRGLPHRMEVVALWDGIEFINDSKATTVQAVCSGLSAFVGKRVALLAGGHDKGLDYAPLARFEDVTILPFGEAGGKIANDTGTRKAYAGLSEAFSEGLKLCKQWGKGVVYLGPACASYDAYNSYEERGQHFRDLCAQAIE